MKSLSRKTIVIIILSILLLSIPLGFKIYDKVKIQNVFDEIYHDQLTALKGTLTRLRGDTTLGDIAGIKWRDRTDAIDFEFPFLESYHEDSLKNPNYLDVSFHFFNQAMFVYFSYNLSNDVTLYFVNEYSLENKELYRNIHIVDLQLEEYTSDGEYNRIVEDKSEVYQYLSDYDIDNNQLEQMYKEGMMDIFLTDWFEVYKSRFSIEDLGKVDIEKSY